MCDLNNESKLGNSFAHLSVYSKNLYRIPNAIMAEGSTEIF